MAEFPSDTRAIFGTAVGMAVLATIAVFLRLLAKKFTQSGLKADDIWILLGLASFWAYLGVVFWGMLFPQSIGIEAD